MGSPRPRRALRGGAAVLLVVAALAVVPAIAGAATFTVNTTADKAPAPGQCLGAPGDCSLRQAIEAANLAAGPDRILVPAGTYALTIPAEGADGNENGDLNVTDEGLTIQGSGARNTIIDATAAEDRVIHAEAGSGLTLLDLTVTGGSTEEDGGGIAAEEAQLALFRVTVTRNVAVKGGSGGGISVDGSSLYVADSTVSHNQNSGDGGGIYTDGTFITMKNSTIADNVVNTALYPENPSWGAYGGGMEVSDGVLTMFNVTIAGNQIIDGNGGEEGTGAGLAAYPKSASVVNTIIADNVGISVEETGQCDEPVKSLGHNLESEAPPGEDRCFEGPTDLIGNPLLGTLADNGGETDTVALGTGSPAIVAGDPAFCPVADQRGFPMQAGVVCDIGAFQTAAFVPAPPVTPTTTTQPSRSSETTQTKPPVAVIAKVKVKKLVKLPKTGKAKLTLTFTDAGKVKVSGKGLKTVSRNVKAGNATLTLAAVGKAKKALTETGKAKLKAKIAFTSTTGAVVSKTRKVTLNLKP